MVSALKNPVANSTWPEDGLEDVKSCPVCGSGERELMYEGLTDRVFFCAQGEWTMYRCTSCDSGYLDPRPTPETIGLAYRTYYTHKDSGTPSTTGWISRARRVLANGYRNTRFGTRDIPALRLGYLIGLCFPGLRGILDATMRNIPPLKPGARLLDIGCGNGEFLSRARDMGWNVYGIDTDPKAVDAARSRNLEVALGTVDSLQEKESFDLIILSHVIEHVHDPLSILRSCFNLLKYGGYLWLATPNINSNGSMEFGASWRGLEVPRHLILFNHNSLRSTLEYAGFGHIEVMPYYDQCGHIYRASKAIQSGMDPYKGDLYFSFSELRLRQKIRLANKIAKQNIDKREFVIMRGQKLEI